MTRLEERDCRWTPHPIAVLIYRDHTTWVLCPAWQDGQCPNKQGDPCPFLPEASPALACKDAPREAP